MQATRDFFAGGTAVITGAGSGIGEGLARHAATLGMNVVLADVAVERMEAVAAAIRAAGGTALAVPTDVRDTAAIERLADAAYAAFGEVRLLVNNAGIELVGYAWELPASAWDRIIDINIRAVIHGARIFAPRMIAAGRRSIIANTASVGGLSIMPLQTPYILSKHAVLSFSECLSLEMQLAKAPVQVSAILPGPVATRIFGDAAVGGERVSTGHRAVMEKMLLEQGISGLEAAERIFPQLAAGDFWVSTHPEFTQFLAEGRAQHLQARAHPALGADTRALLEDPG